MRKLKIGTRESPLALKQTQLIIDLLTEKKGPFAYEIIGTKTLGDRLIDVSLKEIGGKGVFVKDIEKALLTGEIDFAVHSLKDMPYQLLDGLMIAAYPVRGSVEDVLVFREKNFLERPLSTGCVIGTSSARRAVQLLQTYPQVEVKEIRGKVETRLEKLNTGLYDGIVLAKAGLERLALLDDLFYKELPVQPFIPAVGQGTLAVECRKDDPAVRSFLTAIDEKLIRECSEIERTFLGTIEGNCEMPIAAFAEKKGDCFQLSAFLAKDRNSQPQTAIRTSDDKKSLGQVAARELLKKMESSR